jgi:hypothetical protein
VGVLGAGFDALVNERANTWRFLSIFPRVYAGTHVHDSRVSIRRGRTLTLHAPGIIAYADGGTDRRAAADLRGGARGGDCAGPARSRNTRRVA